MSLRRSRSFKFISQMMVTAWAATSVVACVKEETKEGTQTPSSSVRVPGTESSTASAGSGRTRGTTESTGKVSAQDISAIISKKSALAPLPKWKTEWESQLEEMARDKMARGIKHIDQFDDYRKANIDNFALTVQPTVSFRAPAEFEEVESYMAGWTPGLGSSQNKFFADILKGAWDVVPVILNYGDLSQRSFLEGQLTAAGLNPADTKNVIWFKAPLNSIWARDFGPIGIVSTGGGNPKLGIVDFRYYHPRVLDDEVPTLLAEAWGINTFRPGLSWEGGNFMNTTDGLCVTSKGALWFNPNMTQSAVEKLFLDYVGCKKMLFPTPLKGEGTTHIDMFTKFGTDTKVMMGEYTAAQDATNKPILDANATMFSSATNGSGQPLEVTRIPMPNNQDPGASEKNWRTYTNSLSLKSKTKQVVLIPVYAEETKGEATAMAVYAKVFPGWTLVKVASDSIITWGGAVHCVTMQIPVGEHAMMQTAPDKLCGDSVDCTGSVGCGTVPEIGCCEGNMLKFCSEGQIGAEDCSGNGQCGWGTQQTQQGPVSWYMCGTQGQLDPTGTNPKACSAIPADAGTDTTPTDGGVDAQPSCGTVSYQGCCEGETVKYCEGGALKTIDCAQNPSCGWNGQGGFYDCKTDGKHDPSGVNLKNCGQTNTDAGPQKDAAKPIVPCGEVPAQGCCEGTKLKICVPASAGNTLMEVDCAFQPNCGWNAAQGTYSCGTSGGSDPLSHFPLVCGSDVIIPDVGTPDMGIPEDLGGNDASVGGDSRSGSDAATSDTQGGGGGCRMASGQDGSSGLAASLMLIGLAWAISRSRRG